MYRRNDMQYKLYFYTDTFNMMKKPSQPTQLTVDSFFLLRKSGGFLLQTFYYCCFGVLSL